jgi:myo-inositol-1(or 4)-monophosphatase
MPAPACPRSWLKGSRLPGPDDLSLLLAAAEGAGAIARRHFGAGVRVWDKGDGQGPLTEADLEVNDYLRDRLTAARPGWGWMSEESDPLQDTARLDAETLFIVDPIDGTRAFVAGETTFAHALAIVRQGQPVAAVVHLPMRNLTYAATLGGGARLNGRPIAPSPRTAPDGARVLTTRANLDPAAWPGGVPAVDRHFRPSLAWRLALVAEGAFDAALTLRPAWDWDIAAASLIATEAGALSTNRDGAPLRFNTAAAQNHGVLTAPPPLHAALLRALAPKP